MDTSWFTPTFLFCFLNLMILTIFLVNSYSKPHNPIPQLSHNNSSQLNRSSSVLARLKSLKFSSSFNSHVQHHENEHETDSPDSGSDHQVIAPETSDRTVSVGTMSKKPASDEKTVLSGREIEEEAVLAQQPVRQRKPKEVKMDARNTMSFRGEAGVDAKADDFISKFRQQLKLQRLDSMKRFTEMLARGTGATK